MKKKLLSIVLSLGILSAGIVPALASDQSSAAVSNAAQGRVIAFPGAEGGGMYSPGARGALEDGRKIEVYHVTSLENSGPGTFRDAVSKGNRIVVFDVAGNIQLDSNVSINKSNMTILGQTAPGDGICFSDNNIKIAGKNVILRHLRFRVGDKDKNNRDTRAQDGLEVTDNSENIIIDHCSVSWGTDENLSAYAVKDVTIQWSIIAEALNKSVHDKGQHSYAAIWGGVNLSVHHNLIATHKSRNPKIGTSETVSMTQGYRDDETLVELRNNVIYNWGDKAGYGSENGAKTYLINNTYRPGPALSEPGLVNKRTRIFELSAGQKYKENYLGSVYAAGNRIDVEPNDPAYETAQRVNADNWQDELQTGVYVNRDSQNADKSGIRITEPDQAYQAYAEAYPVQTQPAEEAYAAVLSGAGATLPKRDAVDRRIVSNVENRTAPNGEKGSVGLVDSPMDGLNFEKEAAPENAALYDAKGYPNYRYQKDEVLADGDGDGIPDEWEVKMGLDAGNPLDGTRIGPDGYTWLETYVEEAVTHPQASRTVELTAPAETERELAATGGELYDLKARVTGDGTASVQFYFDGQYIADGELSGGEYTARRQRLPSGSGYLSARAYFGDGTMLTSKVRRVHCVSGGSTGDWEASGGLTGYDRENGNYEVYDGLLRQAAPPGGFELVCRIDELPALHSGSQTYLSLYEGDGNGQPLPDKEYRIGLGYNQNYQRELALSGAETKPLPDGGYEWLKISREGNTLTFYAAESLAAWNQVGTAFCSGAGTLYAGVGETGGGVSRLSALRIILAEDKTSPQITLDNIEENQRLGFQEEISATVTADPKAAISEVAVLLNGTVVAAAKDLEITGTETVKIPVSFSEAASGTLRTVCSDENLSAAQDAREVVISADLTPWRLADIGADGQGRKTYASVTDDYTYKLFSPDGSIGGTTDRFGYLYQQFTGDQRIYYRSRMKKSKQFGLVLKSDLSEDGVTYFFGGDKTGGSLCYRLEGRTEKGGEMEPCYTMDSGQDTLYFIAEKVGNWLDIYQSDRTNAIYKTKKPLASIDVSGLGETYYMGFGAVMENESDPPDAGWVVMEEIDETDGTAARWDFDNGLDWGWLIQEKNLLVPHWTEEAIGGNESGKLLIKPDETYSGYRYLFHEYVMDEINTPSMEAKLLLHGDNPELDIYFQTGDANSAYQVTFSSDGKILAGGADTGGVWNFGDVWYTVRIETEREASSYDLSARLTVLGPDGALVTGKEIASSDAADKRFRPQKHPSKTDTTVTKAVYLEPAVKSGDRFYIDDIRVWGRRAAGNIMSSEKFLGFDNETETATSAGTNEEGFSLTAGMPIESNKKEIDNITFLKRIKMDKGSAEKNAISFPVDGEFMLMAYAAQGGTSGERHLIMDDGLNKQELLIKETGLYTAKYTGGAGTVTLYSDSKIYIYGLKTVKTWVAGPGDRLDTIYGRRIAAATVQGAGPVRIVAASYDETGMMLEYRISDLLMPDVNGQVTAEFEPVNSGTSYKTFLWEGTDDLRPLTEAKEY